MIALPILFSSLQTLRGVYRLFSLLHPRIILIPADTKFILENPIKAVEVIRIRIV